MIPIAPSSSPVEGEPGRGRPRVAGVGVGPVGGRRLDRLRRVVRKRLGVVLCGGGRSRGLARPERPARAERLRRLPPPPSRAPRLPARAWAPRGLRRAARPWARRPARRVRRRCASRRVGGRRGRDRAADDKRRERGGGDGQAARELHPATLRCVPRSSCGCTPRCRGGDGPHGYAATALRSTRALTNARVGCGGGGRRHAAGHAPAEAACRRGLGAHVARARGPRPCRPRTPA